MSDAVKALGKALSAKNKDKFEVGDVIRWTAKGSYTYIALKTEGGWYTTSKRSAMSKIGEVLSYEELLDVLNRSETSDVQVASAWVDVQ